MFKRKKLVAINAYGAFLPSVELQFFLETVIYSCDVEKKVLWKFKDNRYVQQKMYYIVAKRRKEWKLTRRPSTRLPIYEDLRENSGNVLKKLHPSKLQKSARKLYETGFSPQKLKYIEPLYVILFKIVKKEIVSSKIWNNGEIWLATLCFWDHFSKKTIR